MSVVFSGRLDVDVDSSQFSLRFEGDPDRRTSIEDLQAAVLREPDHPPSYEPGVETPLVESVNGDSFKFVVAREYGLTPVETVVLDAESTDDPSWEDAAELSFTATFAVVLAGWASDDPSHVLPLQEGVDYRLRYSVRGAQPSWGGDDDPDEYRIEVWPAPITPPRMLRATSQWAGYWVSHWERGGDAQLRRARVVEPWTALTHPVRDPR